MPQNKSYRKKRPTKKRMKRSKLTTVSEVKQIAKKVVYGIAESKYFNTTTHVEKIPATIQTLSQMTCLGFTTGDVLDSVAGSSYQYGTTSMRTLNMPRVYDANDGAPLNNLALEGLYATPSFCQSRFLIERVALATGNVTNSPNRACPYYVRILRLQPRPRKSSNQDVQPNLDAFLDKNGLGKGVFTAGFNKLDLFTLKPNTRKYNVIADIKYTMNTPMTYNLVDIDSGTYNVGPINDSYMRTFNFTHDIGKKLFYKAPDAGGDPNYPSMGFKNEFILIHFQPIGDDDTVRNTANHVRVSVNGVSAFKDV